MFHQWQYEHDKKNKKARPFFLSDSSRQVIFVVVVWLLFFKCSCVDSLSTISIPVPLFLLSFFFLVVMVACTSVSKWTDIYFNFNEIFKDSVSLKTFNPLAIHLEKHVYIVFSSRCILCFWSFRHFSVWNKQNITKCINKPYNSKLLHLYSFSILYFSSFYSNLL